MVLHKMPSALSVRRPYDNEDGRSDCRAQLCLILQTARNHGAGVLSADLSGALITSSRNTSRAASIRLCRDTQSDLRQLMFGSPRLMNCVTTIHLHSAGSWRCVARRNVHVCASGCKLRDNGNYAVNRLQHLQTLHCAQPARGLPAVWCGRPAPGDSLPVDCRCAQFFLLAGSLRAHFALGSVFNLSTSLEPFRLCKSAAAFPVIGSQFR
jgi:hypothetical protein